MEGGVPKIGKLLGRHINVVPVFDPGSDGEQAGDDGEDDDAEDEEAGDAEVAANLVLVVGLRKEEGLALARAHIQTWSSSSEPLELTALCTSHPIYDD